MHPRLSQALQPLRTRNFWWRQLRALVITLVGITVYLYFAQRSFIYHPSPMAPEAFAPAVLKTFPPGTSIMEPFKAIVTEPPAGTPVQATAILFHGNGGLGGGRGGFVPTFTKRGIRLILAEYPGYGPRGGETTEKAIVADARALYTAVLQKYPGTPVILVGESLGSGPAAIVAAYPWGGNPLPSRLVLLTPYRSLPETASRTFWWLPVRLLMKDVYDVESALRDYKGPLGILVAGKDEVVGPAQGRYLGEQARKRDPATAYVELPNSGHNDWRFDIKQAQWDELLAAKATATP